MFKDLRCGACGSQSRKVQDAKAAATETPQKKEGIELPEVNRGGQEEQTKVDFLVSTRQKGDRMQRQKGEVPAEHKGVKSGRWTQV